MLLNHKAGVAAIKKRLPQIAFFDWNMMTDALAEQKPWWPPGSQHGYHALTIGWLVGHVIRNITGMTLGQYLQEEIAGPLDLDLHIGMDESMDERVGQIIWQRFPSVHKDTLCFLEPIVCNPWGATSKAFTNPWGLQKIVNTRPWRAAEIPAGNAHANADSLARFYGILANGGKQGDKQFLSPESIAMCSVEESGGVDAILNWPTKFSLGFMLSQNVHLSNFGPPGKSFGHPGAGGSIGFADPEAKLGFGYVHNQMGSHILVDPRAKALIDAVYECMGLSPN